MDYQEIQDEITSMRQVNRQIQESADKLLEQIKKNQESFDEIRLSIAELNQKLNVIDSQLGISNEQSRD